jgi:hypothetical protein
MMARLVATPLPASFGVGAMQVPPAVQHGTAAAIRSGELEVRELVPNTKAEYSDVQFGTKGPPKECFEWRCLGPNVVFQTPSTKIQYNLLATPEKVTPYFNEHLSKRALMSSNGNRWVGTVLYYEPCTRFESQKYSFD